MKTTILYIMEKISEPFLDLGAIIIRPTTDKSVLKFIERICYFKRLYNVSWSMLYQFKTRIFYQTSRLRLTILVQYDALFMYSNVFVCSPTFIHCDLPNQVSERCILFCFLFYMRFPCKILYT